MAQMKALRGRELLFILLVVALDVFIGNADFFLYLATDNLALFQLGAHGISVLLLGEALAAQSLGEVGVAEVVFLLDFVDILIDVLVRQRDRETFHFGGDELFGNKLLEHLLVVILDAV